MTETDAVLSFYKDSKDEASNLADEDASVADSTTSSTHSSSSSRSVRGGERRGHRAGHSCFLLAMLALQVAQHVHILYHPSMFQCVLTLSLSSLLVGTDRGWASLCCCSSLIGPTSMSPTACLACTKSSSCGPVWCGCL